MPKAIVAASNARVLGRQGERVADVERRGPAGRANRCCATPIIPGEMSMPSTRPTGCDARVEVGRDLAGPGRDVEGARRPAAGRSLGRGGLRQRGSWNAEISRFIGS